MAAKKVGLALGSGFARGLAHVGVLKSLLKESIPIDMIAGTSAGAIIGGMFALGRSPEEIQTVILRLATKRYALLADPALPRTGLVKGKKIREAFQEIFADSDFADLKMLFACVSTDIDTGEPVVMNEGPLLDAVLASSTIPIMMSAVKRNNRFLVDGSLINPVPVNVLREMGADFIIAVNVSDTLKPGLTQSPSIFKIIMQTLHIAGFHALRLSVQGAGLVITPAVEHVGHFDFKHIDECVKLGEEATLAAMPVLKNKLIEAGLIRRL